MTNQIDKSITLAKLQATELDILKIFRDFCEKYNLEWWIDSGTVLGAVRHGGFIPWDDDIDVGMLRSDYDKLLQLAEDDFPSGYSIHTCNNTDGYAAMFAKIYMNGTLFETEETRQAGIEQGIFIDIFPYDFVPQDPSSEKKVRRNARLWQSCSYLFHSGDIVVPHKGLAGFFEKLGCKLAHGVIRKTFSSQGIYQRFEQATSYSGLKSDRVLPFAWPNMPSLPKDVLVPPSKVCFEGESFPCPAQPRAYLEAMYGNWQELPAPEDRRTHLPLKLVFADGEVWTKD